ncbi:uncharacterized protein LOC111372177 [Olea europaea var. sylvestris]|uniref:uncharacterized protein LOC111372177 n=1 Tax=Olea europaea var. sylvestris TaxID=158386 RepID=UPI000C1D3EA0|nr:uncharacterized protein LOC111372177 [Olea europaea var. sylvestris]
MGDGKVSRFSMLEFALITGIRCAGEEEARARIIPNKRLLDLYFGGKGLVTPPQLEDAFRRYDHLLDKLKLGLVYILESILRCRHHRTSIDLFSLDVVDYIVALNSFSWGRRCYTDILYVFRRVHTMSKSERGKHKYDVYGFCMALQLWAYEAILALGSKWTIRRETSCPRIFHWRAHEKPSAKDLTAILDDPQECHPVE